jgi:hypothetical protein
MKSPPHFVELNHTLTQYHKDILYNEIKLLDDAGHTSFVYNDTVISYDDNDSKLCRYLTIGYAFDDRVYAEGPDMLHFADQTPYTKLMECVRVVADATAIDLDLDLDKVFHFISFIVVPPRSTFVPHIDSFRNACISMPLGEDKAITYWTPNITDRIEHQCTTSTILDTLTLHSSDNRSDITRYLFQISFKDTFVIDDVCNNSDFKFIQNHFKENC